MIEAARHHSSAREPWIDFLRGFASLGVVFFHLNEVRNVDDEYADIMSYGWLGVPVFFVISGYCVMISGLADSSAGKFLIKRLMRVFPPYWASLAIVMMVVVVRVQVADVNDVTVLPKEPLAWIATLALATKPVSQVGTINWVYWTLSYEIAFYLVMTVALIRWKFFLPTMLAVTLISSGQMFFQLVGIPGLFFLDYWPPFALGVGLALWSFSRSALAVILTLTSGVLTILITQQEVAIAAILTAISIPILRNHKAMGYAKLERPFAALGLISYSLYLTHVPFGVYLIGHAVHLSSQTSVTNRLGVDLLVTMACVIFAFAFYRVAEQPAQQLSRRLFGKKSAGAAGPGVLDSKAEAA